MTMTADETNKYGNTDFSSTKEDVGKSLHFNASFYILRFAF